MEAKEQNFNYSKEAFEYSVRSILGDSMYSTIKESPTSEKVATVAQKYFILTKEELMAESFERRMEHYVVQQIARNLDSYSEPMFGSRIETWME